MSNVALLQRLGLWIQPNFLSPQLCVHLLSEMRSAAAAPVLVMAKGTTHTLVTPQVDERQRITQQITPLPATDRLIKSRLSDLQPQLEQHFNLSLRGYQEPLFYRYYPGGFFNVHQDCSDAPDAPDFLRDRQISIILFLNRMTQSPQPDSYCGGALAFYGLMSDSQYGFPLAGEAGMLVAFRSRISHEVQRVTVGERYSIVSWFY
jgi:predicted 2-oxoglutarate/Fe(II)-dependent dioxygenase YbiX